MGKLYDRALFIVTADHGVSLRGGDSLRGVTKTNYGDIMSIPLFIKLPNQNAGQIIDTPVSSLDILPTVASVIRMPVPWPVEGYSLLGQPIRQRQQFPICAHNQFSNFTAKDIVSNRFQTVQEKFRLFGSGATNANGLYELADYKHIVGQSVKNLPIHKENAGIQVGLNHQGLGVRSVLMPLSGEISPAAFSESDNVNLAIAVRGKIQATTITYRLPGENIRRFTALIPDSSLPISYGDVSFLLIKGPLNHSDFYAVPVRP